MNNVNNIGIIDGWIDRLHICHDLNFVWLS